MEPHRIVLVAESFFPSSPMARAVDATSEIKHIVDRLIDTGHEVLVMAPGPGLSDYRRARVLRIGTTTDGGSDAEPGAARGAGSPIGPQVRRAYEAWRPDLVHVVDPAHLGRKALKHAHRRGLPTLVSLDRSRFNHSQDRKSERDVERLTTKVAGRADRIVVSSRWLQHALGEHDVRSEVWHPGVDVAAFSPTLRDDYLNQSWTKRGRLAAVGHIGPLKKSRDVRRVAELADVLGCRPVIIGRGAQSSWLRRQLPTGKFIESMTAQELSTALASCDLVLQPHMSSSSAHLLRQAGASGVPVVAPASGGVPDAVRDRRTGLLYDPSDPLALTRAVSTLVAEPQLRTTMGQAARRRAERRTWIDAVDELIAVHYPAVATRRDRAA